MTGLTTTASCAICYIREHPLQGDYDEGYVTETPAEVAPPIGGKRHIFVPGRVEGGLSAQWVCPQCFVTLKERFDWRLAAESHAGPGEGSP